MRISCSTILKIISNHLKDFNVIHDYLQQSGHFYSFVVQPKWIDVIKRKETSKHFQICVMSMIFRVYTFGNILPNIRFTKGSCRQVSWLNIIMAKFCLLTGRHIYEAQHHQLIVCVCLFVCLTKPGFLMIVMNLNVKLLSIFFIIICI